MKLALGTAQFGSPYGVANQFGQVSKEETQRVLRSCQLAGITTIDTASSYGTSEQILGSIGVDRFNIVSKLRALPEDISDVNAWVESEFDQSVKRLNVDVLHGFLLHSPKDLHTGEGKDLLAALVRLKHLGKVKKIGVSVYSPEELASLFLLYKFDIVQCPLNVVDQRLVKTGWLTKLEAYGVEVHTRSSFLQGLLAMPRIKIPIKFGCWDYIWSPWFDWLKANDISGVEGCLSYSMSLSGVDKLVIGVDSEKQLNELVAIVRNLRLHDLSPMPAMSCDDDNLINPSNWVNL